MNNEYIGNAKIIKPSELPKIGDIDTRYKEGNGVVYSIQAIENWDQEDYIFYVVRYGERLKNKDLTEFWHGVDTYHFEYAIKVSDFVKEI